MNKKTTSYDEQLVNRLMATLLAGLASAFILGVLLYLQSHPVTTTSVGALFVAVCLLCLVARNALAGQATSLTGRLRKAGHAALGAGSITFNAMLFAALMMLLMVSMPSGALDTRQMFFLCLLSAMTGMMLATVWKTLALEKSNNRDS